MQRTVRQQLKVILIVTSQSTVQTKNSNFRSKTFNQFKSISNFLIIPTKWVEILKIHRTSKQICSYRYFKSKKNRNKINLTLCRSYYFFLLQHRPFSRLWFFFQWQLVQRINIIYKAGVISVNLYRFTSLHHCYPTRNS